MAKGHNGRRGFASMTPEKQREIASKGGKIAHARGTAHEWNGAAAVDAGRRGGNSVVQHHGREHMAEIGRRGGLARRANRAGDNNGNAGEV